MTCLCGQPDCRYVRMLRERQAVLESMSKLNFPPPLSLAIATEREASARREYEAHTENPVATATHG